MTHATEFFTVQNAIGAEKFNGFSQVSAAQYKAADEQYKNEGRLEDSGEVEVDGFGVCRAIFVDGKLVEFRLNGESAQCDDDPKVIREVLGM